MNRKITEEQYGEAMAMWADGATADEIAERTGIRKSTLVTYTSRRREDFPIRYRYMDDDTLERAFEMRCTEGYTFDKISKLLEVPIHTVIYWFTRGRLGGRYREFQATSQEDEKAAAS